MGRTIRSDLGLRSQTKEVRMKKPEVRGKRIEREWDLNN